MIKVRDRKSRTCCVVQVPGLCASSSVKKGITGLLRGFRETMHVKHLTESAHSTHSVCDSIGILLPSPAIVLSL